MGAFPAQATRPAPSPAEHLFARGSLIRSCELITVVSHITLRSRHYLRPLFWRPHSPLCPWGLDKKILRALTRRSRPLAFATGRQLIPNSTSAAAVGTSGAPGTVPTLRGSAGRQFLLSPPRMKLIRSLGVCGQIDRVNSVISWEFFLAAAWAAKKISRRGPGRWASAALPADRRGAIMKPSVSFRHPWRP